MNVTNVKIRDLCTLYRVIQEESTILWEMIVCVILSKKVHMNMGPILNWPARSPDLTPLDICLWGWLKGGGVPHQTGYTC